MANPLVLVTSVEQTLELQRNMHRANPSLAGKPIPDFDWESWRGTYTIDEEP